MSGEVQIFPIVLFLLTFGIVALYKKICFKLSVDTIVNSFHCCEFIIIVDVFGVGVNISSVLRFKFFQLCFFYPLLVMLHCYI